MLDTVRGLGYLQIDPISSVAPPQYLVLWSRLGAYDRTELDRLLWERHELVEWRAFIYPIEDLPMLRAFMRRGSRRGNEWLKENAGFRRYVMRELEQRGPLLSREIETHHTRHGADRHDWWGARQMGLMLEVLSNRGLVAVAGRRGKQRVWDLAERVYPATETMSLREAEALWKEKRFRALGVKLERGKLLAHPDAVDGPIPNRVTFLSPFDRLVQDAVGEHKGYDYARVNNPTRTALQRCLASLESAEHGIAFSSGLGATTTLMHLVDPGERVVLIADVYGGVYRMTSQVYEPKGYRFDYLPAPEFANLRDHLDGDTRIVWIESPSNPLLNVVDIRAAAEAAHDAGARLVVDNTFATPYLQRPLELGADVVVHSTTKYLGGHSDTVGGFVATNDPTIAERLYFLQKSLGAVPGPFDCWLVLRGIKTLAVRMRQHCDNATAVAIWLERRANVERVFYPGLPTHPGHAIAARQMRDFGGMVSFLAQSPEEAVALVARTKLFKLAESLGGVESLIEHPARMTHASTADAPFAAPRNLVRVSVGIESAEDLVADLEAALVRSAATAGA